MEKTTIAADGIKVTRAGRVDRGAAGGFHFCHKRIGIQVDNADGLRRGEIQHKEKALVIR